VKGSPGKQPFDVNLRIAALCRVAKHLGLKAGEFMLKNTLAADSDRIANRKRNSTVNVKKRRKKLRAIK